MTEKKSEKYMRKESNEIRHDRKERNRNMKKKQNCW
jgi:hypothetical protein